MSDGPLLDLVRSLPFSEPSRDQIEEMRTTVLALMAPAEVARRRGRGWAICGIVLAAAAASAIVLVGRTPETSVPSLTHAAVIPIGNATFAHLSPIPDEVIRLTEGTVHLEVSPLAIGERCRVVVGDGEVEVRGTSFEVEARQDRLIRVAVGYGRVEVRAAGMMRILSAGQRWESTVASAAHAPAPPMSVAPDPVVMAPAPVPTQRRRHVTTVEQHPRSPAAAASGVIPPDASEREFRAGWSALRHGDPAAAAEAFDRAIKIAPSSGIAEDAAFWRATALVKASKPDLARHAFVRFLAEFPHAVRAGEAAAVLGWLLVDAGELTAAEHQFQRAATDAVARVRITAERGLAEIGRQRAP